nr:uncharacterized protein LOC132780525 [Anolis sagrei ordinatus]
MKVLTMALALAIFTGCQAFILQNEANPQLEKLKGDLQEYLRNMTQVVKEQIDYIRRLELTQALVDQLHGVKQRVMELKRELPAEVFQAYKQVVGVSMEVVKKGLDSLRGLKDKATPAADELVTSFYDTVLPFANSVARTVDTYTNAMRRTVAEAANKLKRPKLVEKLERQLGELRNQLVPYAEGLRNKLEAFQASWAPYEKFKEGMEKIKRTFQPLVESVLQAVRKYMEEFKEWAEGPAEHPQKQWIGESKGRKSHHG